MPRPDRAWAEGAGSDQEDGKVGEAALAETVRKWVEGQLRPQGFALPLIKRIGVVVTGLLRAQSARRGDLVMAIDALAITSAESESIARRVARTLDDPRLDSERILPYILKQPLIELLADVLAEHTRSEATDPLHAQRFPRLRVIVDESSKADDVHILVAGLGYQGVVVPLAIRVWKQNSPLPPEEYQTNLTSLLGSVKQLMPAPLREHILLLADRGYGYPGCVDLLNALGWKWLLRIQKQTQIQLADEATVAARELAPKRGDVWVRTAADDSLPAAVAAFRHSGWRECQFVAAWAPESDEPWLLITNLRASKERLCEYASRWYVERLFLIWKTHGWDIEALQMSSPQRLGRYLTTLTLATIWTLVCAVAHTTKEIKDRLARRQNPRRALIQLRLPFPEPATDHRSWPAKFSLITWGRYVFHHCPAQSSTPPFRWALPDWDAPTWSTHATNLLIPSPYD